MNGKIRTRDRCPSCGNKFTVIEEIDIVCKSCNTRPKTYFIFLYWESEKHRITRDQDGHMLDSFRRAHRLLENIRSEIDNRTFVINNYLAKEIEQFRGKVLFPKWLAKLRGKGNALSYLVKIEQYIDDHFEPRLGDLNMREIRTHHIEDFRTYLSNEYVSPRSEKMLHPKSIKNVMDQLKAFCSWLYQREIIVRIPHFDVVAVPEPLIQVMPIADREKALAAIKSPLLNNILSFLAWHPVRPSESAALDVRHFDLKNRVVKIEFALDCDRSLKPRKNMKAYEIPLSIHWESSCIQGRFGKEIAFPNKLGGRYTAWTLNEAWKRACKRADVPYVSLYPAMRHTTATGYASNGASEVEIEMMLGHSTRGMSRKYVKRSVEMVRHLADSKPADPNVCAPFVHQKKEESAQ
jgi:integrase